MVMQLGMSPAVGQRLLGGEGSGNIGEGNDRSRLGQQQGGPFMGRDFMGQGAPPVSQQLKQQVDGEVKRIVDEQYQRGVKLLQDNMYLLDELAKMLLDQEKVSGEELFKLINQAAAEGKLVMSNKMAVAAYAGEEVTAVAKKSRCVHPDKPMMFACADCPRRGFCGTSAVPKAASARSGRSARAAVARLGLAAEPERACTSDVVMEKEMASDISNGQALPESLVKSVAVSTMVALCASAAPLPALADDAVPPMQPFGAPQMQQAPASWHRRRRRVDFYDLGRTAVALVNVAGREQQLVCDLPGATTGLIEKLTAKKVQIEVHQPEKPNPLFGVLGDIAFPLLVIGGLLFLRSRGPAGGGIPGFGNQGKAKIMITPETGVKFENVAGIDEAKEELMEIAPERFVKVGAKIPRGVLLTGPPGTGKTLMAKALAGESGVPFIQSSASEYIELFVGDILDSALLRPGRFDRRVQVALPDVQGREEILKVHVKNKKLAENITLTDIAKRTAGFSGADLENLMNESAILTARRNKKAITMDEINDATDRVIAGLEGRSLTDNASKKLIAYHEDDIHPKCHPGAPVKRMAGHAIVGTLLPYHDPVNKVTLIPRGQAKGLTWFTPGEDQSLISAAMLKARIAGALGGRAAEQLVFGSGQVTTGAGGDLQQVERMARSMVTQFGMSEVGSIAIDDGGFMGPSYSEERTPREPRGPRRSRGSLSECTDHLDEEP
eukprot:g20711.t1